MEPPAPPTQPKARKSSRVATSPRKEKPGKPQEESIGLDETLETEEISDSSESKAETSSSETNSVSSKKKSKKKKAKREKVRELLAFVGKGKANMWIESVKASLSDQILKQLEAIQTGTQINIAKKYERFDQELYAEILKALMSSDASPETEATALFNKISSHGGTIKRSGLKALILLQETVNGRADTYGTTLIQEALTIRILHNNVEGVISFLAKFRGTQTKLGNAFPYTWAAKR